MKTWHLIILFVLGVILTLVGLVSRERGLRNDWDVELRRMSREEAAWEAQDFSRRPMHTAHHTAELEGENGWAHLQEAGILAREGAKQWHASHGGQSIHAFMAKGTNIELAFEPGPLRRALDELRLAARCSYAQVPVIWGTGPVDGYLKLLDMRLLTNILIAGAEAQVAAGQDEDAVLFLADALSMGRDLACGSATQIVDLIGTALIIEVCRAIAESEELLSLDPTALAELAACLEAVDRGLGPYGPALQANFLMTRHMLITGSAGMEEMKRREVLSVLRWLEELTDLAKRSSALPWAQAQKLWTAAPEGPWGESGTPLPPASSWLWFLEQRRDAQAILRMTRMLVAERRSEDWLPLRDPYGTELLWSRGEGHFETWSAKDNANDPDQKAVWPALRALVTNGLPARQ